MMAKSNVNKVIIENAKKMQSDNAKMKKLLLECKEVIEAFNFRHTKVKEIEKFLEDLTN